MEKANRRSLCRRPAVGLPESPLDGKPPIDPAKRRIGGKKAIRTVDSQPF